VYNVMCGGQVLDDIELRRNDVAFLDALGARTIPDPTTEGDFCRRFPSVRTLRNFRTVASGNSSPSAKMLWRCSLTVGTET
jgi:hypothetical protein